MCLTTLRWHDYDCSIDRGTCICEREQCECKIAPLSGLAYFGQGETAANSAADNNNCACDPDNCYNSDFNEVNTKSMQVSAIELWPLIIQV